MRFYEWSSLKKNRSLILSCKIKIYLSENFIAQMINYVYCGCIFWKFYYTQHSQWWKGTSIYHSNDSIDYRLITYMCTRITSHVYAWAYTYTHTLHTYTHVIPSRNDMASTKMRVSCSHWYCFAHLRKKDRSKAPHIHTRSSLRFFFLSR